MGVTGRHGCGGDDALEDWGLHHSQDLGCRTDRRDKAYWEDSDLASAGPTTTHEAFHSPVRGLLSLSESWLHPEGNFLWCTALLHSLLPGEPRSTEVIMSLTKHHHPVPHPSPRPLELLPPGFCSLSPYCTGKFFRDSSLVWGLRTCVSCVKVTFLIQGSLG